MLNYKANDPGGWCGNPSRGAALGRHDIRNQDRSAPITLHLQPVRLDSGGYDVNGTYYGSGDPLFWYADEDGTVDVVTRAKNREHARSIVLKEYPAATIVDVATYAGEGDRDPFVVAYATCALWSSTDEHDEPLDDGRDIDDIAPDAFARMVADCKAFREQAGTLLDGLDEEQAGHDFWLTRNGHGAGFWDRGLGERGDALTKLCKPFGEVYLYVGDDDKIHT